MLDNPAFPLVQNNLASNNCRKIKEFKTKQANVGMTQHGGVLVQLLLH
jgi:hypothetical protein